MKIRKFNILEKESENKAIAAQAVLTERLADASNRYYTTGSTVMTDSEFDRLCAELKQMEDRNGFAYHNSPNVSVGSMAVTELETDAHEVPALSLDKVKYANREELVGWLGVWDGVLSLKCDGSTVVVTYENGKLFKAVTRGNGVEGSVITHNAVHFKGLPEHIPYDGHLVIRGEATMRYEEFSRINEQAGGVYENARNLATATIQMLDPEESRDREIEFRAFKMVAPQADKTLRTEMERFAFLEQLGIKVVEHEATDGEHILEAIDRWEKKVKTLDFPTDGLVISYDDQMYADSLGNTGHHPRGSVAMKWTDETKETTIRDIEWSVGKTGAVTPVAIFDTVRLGIGSNVRRASLHNLSIMKHVPVMDAEDGSICTAGIGSRVRVFLANMIIPQVASATAGTLDIPEFCPVCGSRLEIRNNGGVETLWCVNPDCAVKATKRLETFFSKDGCYAKGLGGSQIEDLMNAGLVTADPVSFYQMAYQYADYDDLPDTEALGDGWGKKSWKNLVASIEVSKDTDLQHFLYALSIPLLGHDLSKKLNKLFHGKIGEWMDFVEHPDREKLVDYEGVGDVKADNVVNWCLETMRVPEKYDALEKLVRVLHFREPEQHENAEALKGLTFVITGSVHEYRNRDEFKASVEARGGKVSGSVSAKTSFLVNNDLESTSGKNKKAKELGISIISEDQFIERFGK